MHHDPRNDPAPAGPAVPPVRSCMHCAHRRLLTPADSPVAVAVYNRRHYVVCTLAPAACQWIVHTGEARTCIAYTPRVESDDSVPTTTRDDAQALRPRWPIWPADVD